MASSPVYASILYTSCFGASRFSVPFCAEPGQCGLADFMPSLPLSCSMLHVMQTVADATPLRATASTRTDAYHWHPQLRSRAVQTPPEFCRDTCDQSNRLSNDPPLPDLSRSSFHGLVLHGRL